VRPATAIILLYVGYAAGSLQVLAFKDMHEVLGVLVGISILLVIVAGVMNSRQAKQTRTIPKRSSAKNSKAGKSKLKVVGR